MMGTLAAQSSTPSFSSLYEWLFRLFASILAFLYSLIPNYVIAIVLLTLLVMLVLTPLTIKQTRQMIAMQRLQPEIQKVRQKYKDDRQKQSEEMMALQKEHGVPLTGGCLTMLLQWPVFLILYGVIRGLTATTSGRHPKPHPRYVATTTLLYHDLVKAGGKMMSFGIDLAKSATNHHASFAAALPYWGILAVTVTLGYLQMQQISRRNPAMGQMNPQMQNMQKFMPIMFGVIYVFLSALLNVYFIVSSLYRIVVQELLFRYDPVLAGSTAARGTTAQEAGSPAVPAPQRRTLRRGLSLPRPQQPGVSSNEDEVGGNGSGGKRGSSMGGGKVPGTAARRQRETGKQGSGKQGSGKVASSGSDDGQPAAPKSHPRSQAKRPRRPR